MHMLFKPEHVESAVGLLRSSIEMIGAKAGCRSCILSRDALVDGRIHYYEEWESEARFQQHLHSGEFQRVLLAMDMSAEEPEVTVGTLSGERGIACLRNLRDTALRPGWTKDLRIQKPEENNDENTSFDGDVAGRDRRTGAAG